VHHPPVQLTYCSSGTENSTDTMYKISYEYSVQYRLPVLLVNELLVLELRETVVLANFHMPSDFYF
jgi:hypothetical protein